MNKVEFGCKMMGGNVSCIEIKDANFKCEGGENKVAVFNLRIKDASNFRQNLRRLLSDKCNYKTEMSGCMFDSTDDFFGVQEMCGGGKSTFMATYE